MGSEMCIRDRSVAKSRRESRDELRQVIKDLYDHIGFVPPKPKKRQRACLRIRRARQKERELAAQQAAHKLILSRAANVVREWVRRRQDNDRAQQLTLCVSAFARWFMTASRTRQSLERRRLSTTTRTRSTICLLYTSPSPRDLSTSRMPSSA